LIEEGYLRKKGSRRLEVNPAKIGAEDGSSALDYPKGPAEWDEIILNEVMLSSLSLSAVYLREGPLVEKYGVGRSIIRTSFNRFAGAGLLDHIPHHGWRVHPFRLEDLEAYLAVREALELMALDLARPILERSELLRILNGENHGLNNAMHRYIIEKSGNRYIIEFFKQFVARYYTKLLYYAAPETSVVDDMTLQHQRILEALADGRWEEGRKELSAHIRAQKCVLEQLMLSSRGT
jgi:DNA-binding GntR family transcriptional regulator